MKAIICQLPKEDRGKLAKEEIEILDDSGNPVTVAGFDLSIEVEIPRYEVTVAGDKKPKFVNRPMRLSGTLTIPCEVEIERHES